MRRHLPFFALATALGACDPGVGEQPGMETAACLEGSCLGELECLSNLCVAPEASDTEAGDGGNGDGDGDGDGDGGNDGGGSGNGSGGGSGNEPAGGDSGDDTAGDSGGDDGGGGACSLPQHTPCGGDTIAKALGLCSGDFQVTKQGADQSIGLRTGLGSTDTWAPTEGNTFVAIGSGMIVDLDLETPDGDSTQAPTHCSDDMTGSDPGNTLPEPLSTTPTVGDCVDIPSLIGTGDCSNTLATAFGAGGTANDWAAVRIDATVPTGVRSISYDYAFFTAEYPAYVDSNFTDMHVAWLESEAWTGNIALDGSGGVVSASSSVLDHRDDGSSLPEFAGTCMRGHAGSNWVRASAPVSPGEDITLVLAVFDMSDGIVDSYAFLDNVAWSCDAVERPENVSL